MTVVHLVAYRQCSVKIVSEQLEFLQRVYPYESVNRPEIRRLTFNFLQRHFIRLPMDTKIFAISNYGGCGDQWGIILIQRRGASHWELIAHFGRPARIANRLAPQVHESIIKGATIPMGLPDPSFFPLTETRTLKEFYRHCGHLDLADATASTRAFLK